MAARDAMDTTSNRRRVGPRGSGDEEADEGEVDSLSGVGRTQPPRAAAASLSGRQSH